MQTLAIDPPLPFLLPPDVPIQVVLVGAGGTGSHILQSLARIAAHLGPVAPQITVIDGDVVEPKNVGRQLFSQSDVGLNKAQALAARFSAVFGLQIEAIPKMADLSVFNTPRRGTVRILVGAVDTPAARTVLHDALSCGYARVWLDCGNEEHSGQVCLGTKTDAAQLRGALALGLCRDLPAPSLVYPNLIAALKKPKAGDCAAQMERNLQGLMVNQAVAAVAAQYLHDLIVARRVTTFETTISLAPIAMRSRPITAAHIAEAARIPLADLAPPPARVTPKKGRRAA
jgi:PRTRC genetic system ThiF family protein